MSEIGSKIENLIEDLGSISDPQDKFVYIVERAKSAPDFPEEAKIDQFRVPGCLSHMWIYPRSEGNICYYQVESDAQIPKGIAVLITELFDIYATGKYSKIDALRRVAEKGLTSRKDKPITPQTWKNITFELTEIDGSKLTAQLSRPNWWIKHHKATEIGNKVFLSI